MTHYVLIDGQLQKSSPATQKWVKRAAKGVPRETEDKPDVVALFQVEHESEEET